MTELENWYEQKYGSLPVWIRDGIEKRWRPYQKEIVTKFLHGNAIPDTEWNTWLELDSWSESQARSILLAVSPRWKRTKENHYAFQLLESPMAVKLIGAAISIGSLPHLDSDPSDPRRAKRFRPREFIEWALTKTALQPIPIRLCEALDESQDAKRSKPQLSEGNAAVRAEYLGAALWCIHNYPDNCIKNKKIVAARVAKQIEVHYKELWPENGFTSLTERWGQQIILKHLSRRESPIESF